MVFWRKKKNAAEQEREEQEDKIVHPDGEPAIEPATEEDEPALPPEIKHDLEENGTEILDDMDEEPVPEHGMADDAKEEEELSDHSEEGGWLSRLTGGLSKSTNKITQGLSDLVTKKKLDQDTLEELEEVKFF